MRTKEQLLQAPLRDPLDEVHGATSVYLIPSGENYENNTNYQLITLVAEGDGELVNCGRTDALFLRSDSLVVDCVNPSGIIRIHRHGSRIAVSISMGGIIDLMEDNDYASKKG